MAIRSTDDTTPDPLGGTPVTHLAFAADAPPGATIAAPEYRPGVCNIGPAEIARRRRAGHIGLVASVALLAVLVAIDAPPLARLALVIPVTIAASGYLQAWLKFCAGFGGAGVFNFGDVGTTQTVADEAARAADRRRAGQIGFASFAIGLAVGIAAVLLPI
jgi:hypothetical protein